MLKSWLTAFQKTFRNTVSSRKGCCTCQVPLHQLAQSLGNAVDAKDPSTFNHSEDVARVSELLARLLGLCDADVETIHIAAHLHDIGKIGIPDAILKKPGRLDDQELGQIRMHPEIGARIVQPILLFSDPAGVADIILYHHERFDGCGYPSGLAGSAIPLGSRIIGVADALSAMLQNRSYRRGATYERALEEIVRCSGSQFDPAIVTVMYNHFDLVEAALTVEEKNRGTAVYPVPGGRKHSWLPVAENVEMRLISAVTQPNVPTC